MSTVRDLIEEAKKRIVFLIICVVGFSYLMSLTSSSVLVNLPAAAFLIIVLRYLSLDFDMRRKAAALNQKPSSSANISSQTKPLHSSKAIVLKSAWRRKVNSPIVEAAIDQFTRHLVSEWVTDLWYSRITPDRQGPEELVQIINGVLGELASRMRNINLIDFLTRDVITLICTHLELYRISQTKIEKQELGLQSIERRDKELKYVLAAEKKLHPALFSAEAEHKVLQHLMDGLISFTFKPEDLQCSLFRYIVRELLACTVLRPVLNLASPRFINVRIESLVISSKNKANSRGTTLEVASQSSPNGSLRISTGFIDPSAKGVELMQLKKDQSKNAADNVNGTLLSKDPLLSIDPGSTRSWNSLLSDSQTGNSGNIQKHPPGGEWGDMLDSVSRKKTEALAPEHFENMWTKGRNYRKNGAEQFNDPVSQSSSARTSTSVNCSKTLSGHKEKNGATKVNPDSASVHSQSGPSYVKRDEHNHMGFEDVESESTSSYTTEDEEPNSITGLDSPGTKVWDGKSNRNVSVSHIHHPLESSAGHKTRKTNKGRPQTQRLPVTVYGRKRSRLSSQRHVWQEVDRTSFISGDGQDLLHSSKRNAKLEDSSEDSETEMLGRIGSGAAASSSASPISIPESHSLDVNASKNSLLEDSFFKLRCEVLGANIVKSGSKTFAVYSVSVTDVNNNSWSIKRRFRHFEELHRRLKEFPEYKLHLPPKHFLSTGLDVPVIQERCNLLDKYLKKLLQLPTISRSIEVWDFLSVDSQTYVFSNSISIIETLSDNLARERNTEVHNIARPVVDTLSSEKGHSSAESKDSPLQTKGNGDVANGSGLDTKHVMHPPPKKPAKEPGKQHGDSGRDSENFVQTNISSVRNSVKTKKFGEDDGLQASPDSAIDDATDPTLPTEWVPPNLSVPIFDLVDVIFQLQDGGWIRRKAFWVAKQVLQLGMGDAFDDWLLEKIQLLHRGSVVASGIRRVEQILWPDGYFITKHPKRQRPAPSGSPSQSSPHGRPSTPMSSPKTEDIQKLDEQQKEAERRAKFVYELMIDNAPAAIVGLVGRKEYEQCAKDLYYFLQSSVCLKQFAFDLLELLLLSALPEMDSLFRQLHEEKEKFGEFKPE